MKRIVSCTIFLLLSGCASIQSTVPGKDYAKGLYYYMPRKDFVATITMKGGKITKVALAESAAYPDTTKAYLLNYNRNLVGKNAMTVAIKENGLLASTGSQTTSEVSDALKALVSAAADVHGKQTMKLLKDKDQPCTVDFDYVFIFSPTDPPSTHCAITFTIRKQGSIASHGDEPAAGATSSGVFYRQNEPYLVTASGAEVDTAALLFSPSDSPTFMLPIEGALFANSNADFGFTDGVPTKFNQDADGELVGLLKLPADVFSAYFSALGSAFDAFKNTDSKEADALNQQTKLELAKQKYQLCLAAIAANDKATQTSLGCGS